MRPTVTIEQIDACLPQTQCTQCGYPCCRDYAEALAAGAAGINQCPPGGDVTIQSLGTLLRVPPRPLDPRFGSRRPRVRAVIDEALCIGCRQCIDACPVDAILGARKLMHTVLARECTGCELCLPPCPVDCIDLVRVAPAPGVSPWPAYTRAETARWRARAVQRRLRLARKPPARRAKTNAGKTPLTDSERIRAEIRAAVERVKSRKRRRAGTGASSA